MIRLLTGLAVGLCLLATGCSNDGKLQTRGRLLKGGQPLIPNEGESVRVTFVPIVPNGGSPKDHYFAEFERSDATFRSAGKDRRGMPAGRYRVAVEYKRNKQDIFRGNFDEDRSPFVFDINAGTQEIVIDLDVPPKGGSGS